LGPDLQNVLDALLDGVVVLDPDERIERMNGEACRLLELSPQSATGECLRELLGDEHPLVELVSGAWATRRGALLDDVQLARRGTADGFGEVHVDLAATPFYDDDAHAAGILVTVRDRTVHNTLLEHVERRNRLATYGRIAAGIAHEVKNPLGGIRGAAELLARRAADDRAKTTADLIVREVDRISSLVEDLMVFARGDEVELQKVNLHRVLDDVLELVSHEDIANGIGVLRSFDPSIPELLTDEKRLKQVLLNLIRNALQAMSECGGGELSVQTRIDLEYRIDGVSSVDVSIHDSGPGIPPDVLEQLPTPFFTTRPDGTGLGLSVCHHWIQRLGGTLRIESQAGMGTVARIALPRLHSEQSDSNE